ncbi:heme ABC transporter ATP-binding protein [Gracilibacillus alcaliphilus]|uniref:heme ABC transporter ATP-binding protein n=1 Tax=Gracilibacillus alcaliphilus TaxID=1401441 RepID=UPI00195976F9|nr:iron complex transport system ATP-binding protein [Gracilibacillus alcaliphilus]
MKLKAEHIHFSYQTQNILHDINLHAHEGEFVGIIGPNGSGKSTLLKNIYRSLQPNSGVFYLDGVHYQDIKVKELAQKLSVIGQENTLPFDFSVKEIVAMGRSPHKKLFESDTQQDTDIIIESLRKVEMDDKRNRNYLQLSGGEKQRVLLARVLAQQTDFLILDEPTNHLDIYHQMKLFDLIKGLRITVLSAIHDLNMAALYCDRLYVMNDGAIYTSGKPEDILTEQLLQEVFHLRADVATHPVTNKQIITFIPEHITNKGAK